MTNPVSSPKDALLYIDYFARFSTDETVTANMNGVADVIRSLMRKVEQQALQNERLEAKNG